MAANFTPKVNRVYELQDGRVGVLKFVGRTFFKPGVDWYGFELNENFKGKNNGSCQGVSYFKCKVGQGVFVKRAKIVKEVSARKGKKKTKIHKAGSREIGRNDYKAAKYEIQDTGSFLEEKTSGSKSTAKAEKKLGPREIGRIDYDAVELETPEDTGSFLEERVAGSTSTKKAAKKQGPREIGRNEDYDAAEFEVPQEAGSFLDERTTHSANEAGKAEHKLGPREIGTSDYNPGPVDQ